jgi:hypothetical protein
LSKSGASRGNGEEAVLLASDVPGLKKPQGVFHSDMSVPTTAIMNAL